MTIFAKPVFEHCYWNKINAAKKADNRTDTSELEREIDELVYQLYELKPDEITIVEGKQK